MRVLVAGASGVIGRQLLPLLHGSGHEVIALVHTHRPPAGYGELVVADALDGAQLSAAVRASGPEVVVNLLTAIPGALDPRRFESQFARTNLLRTEGTANLIAAAAGARMISQGVAFAYSPVGGPVADEDRPLWETGPKPFRPAVRALLELERRTLEAGGVVLRFGHLYGPGTAFAADGSFTAGVRAGRVPIVGDGSGCFSFTHTYDAATATLDCVTRPEVREPLNVVDDRPTPVARWLPELANLVGGPEPKQVPSAVARLAVGSWGVAYMNGLVGADNRRARQRLDWRPRYPTVQDGLRAELGAGPPDRA